jgi:hypothetical protein
MILKRRGTQNKTKPSQFVIDEEKIIVTQSVREREIVKGRFTTLTCALTTTHSQNQNVMLIRKAH